MRIDKSNKKTDISNIHNHLYKALVICLLIFLCAAIPSNAKENVLQQLEKEFKKVVSTASPVVVKVIATRTPASQLSTNMRKKIIPQQNISSGIIFDKDGHIVTTTFDMLPTKIEVIYNTKKRVPAKIIGMDDFTDLVVLKTEHKLRHHVKLGDSKKIDTGSWVVTVGNSRGQKPIISFGIASGREFLPDRPCSDLIKINAPISPGNSGGAVVNTSGEVVGMILGTLSEPNIQNPFSVQFPLPMMNRPEIVFAVPIETVKSVATEIIKHGKMPRGWLGVNINTNELGVFVTRVTENSPAHLSGILPQDLILEFNGTPVNHYSHLFRCVGITPPHTEIKLKIQRNGQDKYYHIKLGER
ncbi:MAG: trypsin-like peptidase domain-containing protein [Candidatus Poribacteria bacterium]|nr:trypsin-like peptidase domain-containing protein [Candidatus Poribacteria bacterium]